MTMLDAVVSQVCKRLDSKDKLYQPPKGWDASDPDGCWTHDYKKGEAVDYCDGFKMFDTFDQAMEYAATVKWNAVRCDRFMWAGKQVTKWTVTEYDGPRG